MPLTGKCWSIKNEVEDDKAVRLHVRVDLQSHCIPGKGKIGKFVSAAERQNVYARVLEKKWTPMVAHNGPFMGPTGGNMWPWSVGITVTRFRYFGVVGEKISGVAA